MIRCCAQRWGGAERKGQEIKQFLKPKYKMCDLGMVETILEIDVETGEDARISIWQPTYAYINMSLK
jgi:hypothetical protein